MKRKKRSGPQVEPLTNSSVMAAGWTSDEKRNVAEFFQTLDRWDRRLKTKWTAMIAEATAGCAREKAQRKRFQEVLAHRIKLPVRLAIDGKRWSIERIDVVPDGDPVAIATRGRATMRMDLLKIPWNGWYPEGGEWIDAYRHWRFGDHVSKRPHA